MPKRVNLEGVQTGRLLVKCHTEKDEHGSWLWECLCACGTTVKVRTHDLTSKRVLSCGCLKRQRLAERNKNQPTGPVPARRKDIPAGTRFSLLTTTGKFEWTRRRWFTECLCDCGKTKLVIGNDLRTGRIKSCGCLSEKYRERFKSPKGLSHFNVTHGATAGGSANTLLRLTHNSWRGMLHRCDSRGTTASKNYGDIGITYDPRWADFRVFLRDMGLRPSKAHWLDRIDPAGNYAPGNVRWLEGLEANASNKRTTHWIVFQGRTLTLAQFSRKIGLCATGVARHLRLGLTPDDLACGVGSRKLATFRENEACAQVADTMGAVAVAKAIRARRSKT